LSSQLPALPAAVLNLCLCLPLVQVMVLSMDAQRGRVTLSTKKLEPTPGDMLRDPQLVFEKAEEMAEAFRKRVESAEVNARSQMEMGVGAAAPYSGEAGAAGDFDF
jgi:hypothetical protein